MRGLAIDAPTKMWRSMSTSKGCDRLVTSIMARNDVLMGPTHFTCSEVGPKTWSNVKMREFPKVIRELAVSAVMHMRDPSIRSWEGEDAQ